MRKFGYIVYIVLFLVVLTVPLAGMFLDTSKGTAQAAEKRDLASMPSLISEDGTVNISYLGDVGAWYEDHFGFRDEMITANSFIRKATVRSSADDEVIIGRDGWLFYSGTTDDYLGRDLLSQREIFDAVHNLRLIQNYVRDADCRFLFVVAANKNSLYGSYMPYSYVEGDRTNVTQIWPYLEAADISCLDLHGALSGQEGLYFERDTHWNGKGALIGYNEIMDALETPHETYSGTRWMWRDDHMGDLDEMLLPSAWTAETEYYLDTRFTYTYVGGEPESMRDPLIQTRCDTGIGRLYMFRDSFADSLIPLLSQHFANATYSMYTPWNLPDAVTTPGTDVVIELVERNLTDLVNRPAILPAPEIEDITVGAGTAMTEAVRAVIDGPYVRISGRIDRDLLPDAGQIAVRVSDGNGMRAYIPFYTSNETREGNSFCLYLSDLADTQNVYVEVCVGSSFSDMRAVYSGNIDIESGGTDS